MNNIFTNEPKIIVLDKLKNKIFVDRVIHENEQTIFAKSGEYDKNNFLYKLGDESCQILHAGWQAHMIAKFPKLFHHCYQVGSREPIAEGIGGNEDWQHIIEDLCQQIQTLIDEDVCDQIYVVQIKNKFGGLSFYWSAGSATDVNKVFGINYIHNLVDIAEARVDNLEQKKKVDKS